jgi:hypothetical protein
MLTESNNCRYDTQLFIDQANHHPLIDVLIQSHLRIRGEGCYSWERSLFLSAFSESSNIRSIEDRSNQTESTVREPSPRSSNILLDPFDYNDNERKTAGLS